MAPKLVPVMRTEVPTKAEEGETFVIFGGPGTVKAAGLLAKPPTVTMTLPVDAPFGTGTTMFVALQLVGVATVPLKVTMLLPCDKPKFVPVIVTDVPAGPDAGLKLVITGVTVKLAPLLAKPLTVTTTFPVVAPAGTGTTMLVGLQLVGVAATPLNVTGLPLCAKVKFVPVIVIEVPTGPAVGLRLVMLGVMLKLIRLLATPETTT